MAGSAIETPGSREVIVDGNVAIVTDSNVCLPHEIVQRHGIQVVPILVIFGERVLRDGIDITPREFCARLKATQPSVHGKPRCVICGGETTVTLGKTYGKGGRNQEFALSSAFALEETERIVVAACGTDGNDGPTDAAGAIVDHSTISRAKAADIDTIAALRGHNAYPLFETIGDLVKTGPTQTNVMDLYIGIITP